MSVCAAREGRWAKVAATGMHAVRGNPFAGEAKALGIRRNESSAQHVWVWFGKINYADNIALIELLTPADTSQPNVQPICMPVTPELRTNAKTNLYVVTRGKFDIFDNFLVRCLESDECKRHYAEKQVVLNLEHKRLCAVIASKDKYNCSPLASGAPLQEMKMFGGKEQYFLRGFELSGLACRSPTPPIYNSIEAYVDWILYNMRGSTYEVTVPNEDGLRYFLYGMHVDDTYYFLDLDHGPYIFHKTEQTDLAWILENVGVNERQSSLPSEALRSRYNKVRSRASGGRP
uniref:Peptidase S1 domain-containing protein n=1 Tax=Anopheles coluzzii TaxID=1518534 RepID=A0A8W7PJU8_ANOCL